MTKHQETDDAAAIGRRMEGTSERKLILILGDQLSPAISSLKHADPRRDVLLLCEVAEETRYVRHHKRKIAFLFSAMRHFAEEMTQAGWHVDYVRLDDPENSGTFSGEVARAVERHAPQALIVTEPGEWRVLDMMAAWRDALNLPVQICDDDRFICSRADFATWAGGRKQLRMEYFYRDMRRRTGLLMRGETPEGGRWNFDADNRKPASVDLFARPRRNVAPDAITSEVIGLVGRRFSGHFGSLDGFGLAVTRADAEQMVDDFVAHYLRGFGDHQDAMLSGDPFINHSLLSMYINCGLVDPLDVCRRVERAYHEGAAPLNAAEGFIRQIIGWREYMRGVYWLKMPDYRDLNFFEASRPLPDFYWTGETEMACIRTVVSETRAHAYAHHIQRLMITGNFAMLAGIDPQAVHRWYLEVYADAYEWVELPNVIGMSQFADGGFLGSKPYAAGGNYINKMSDYCGGCRYDVKAKTGEGACPFNALYWDFLDRQADRLKGNPRLGPVYAAWARMRSAQQDAYRRSAATFLAAMDAVPRVYAETAEASA